MLKLTLKPGDYINIGEEIKVVFSGGSANNIHLLIDAPKKYNIQRQSKRKHTSPYYAEKAISQEAQQQIVEIIKREKKNNGNKASLT